MASDQMNTIEDLRWRQRLLSFSSSEESTIGIAASAFATAGFTKVQLGDNNSDHVVCEFCGLEGKNFSNHPPCPFHKVHSRQCPYIMSVENQTHEPKRPTPDAIHRDAEREPELSEEQTRELHKDCFSMEHINLGHINIASQATITEEPRLKEIKSGRARRLTFKKWPRENIVSSQKLSAKGFVYTGRGDEVKCAFCEIRINIIDSIYVDKIHWKKNRDCPFLKGDPSTGNIPDYVNDISHEDRQNTTALHTPSKENWEKVLRCAKEPVFAVHSVRESTFKTWPHRSYSAKSATEMLEHSLYYTGRGDTVACFSCGVKMSNWSPEEDVWGRHASEAPRCQLVSIWKGPSFLAGIRPRSVSRQQPRQDVQSLEAFMASRLVEKAIDLFQYSRDVLRRMFMNNPTTEFAQLQDIVKVIEAEKKMLRRPVNEPTHHPEVVKSALVHEQDVGNHAQAAAVPAENDKRCTAYDCANAASFTLLPCLHLVCADCKENELNCEFCGEEIRGSIHAWIG